MEEGEVVGVFVRLERGLVQEAANGKVGHQQPVKLLPNQFRCLAAQDDLGAPQMSFQFVQSRLSGKGLARCDDTTSPVSSPSPSELLVRFSLKQLAQ